MTQFKLPPKTTTAAVALTITDLKRSLNFYQNVLGLMVQDQREDDATLGSNDSVLLHLTESPSAKRPGKTTGLYHFAIRIPTRRDLASVVKRIAERGMHISGFADHLVSEAIYLPDPDGNGIEIYWDRPREAWYDPDGHLRMATEPLDLNGLLGELDDLNGSWHGLPHGTRIGHVHLHVADLELGINFYRDILGLDLMMRYRPSAAFLSAGGYHHHVGINTWNGQGAPQPPEDSVGLRYFTLQLPEKESLAGLRAHLIQRDVPYKTDSEGIWVSDPSSNKVLISPPSL
jgi:catechol 2,3-dioxygenase